MFNTHGLSYTRAQAISLAGGDASTFVDAGFPHARGLYIGVAGNVSLRTTGGDDVTVNAQVGFLYIEAVKIYAGGTTASGIVALY